MRVTAGTDHTWKGYGEVWAHPRLARVATRGRPCAGEKAPVLGALTDVLKHLIFGDGVQYRINCGIQTIGIIALGNQVVVSRRCTKLPVNQPFENLSLVNFRGALVDVFLLASSHRE